MRDFGEDQRESDKPAKVFLSPRSLNYVEQHLLAQLAVAELAAGDPPFIDDETDSALSRIEFDLRNMLLGDALNLFRRQIIVARELGPIRPDGGPFTSEYELACELEGIQPWPTGDKLSYEPPRTEQTK